MTRRADCHAEAVACGNTSSLGCGLQEKLKRDRVQATAWPARIRSPGSGGGRNSVLVSRRLPEVCGSASRDARRVQARDADASAVSSGCRCAALAVSRVRGQPDVAARWRRTKRARTEAFMAGRPVCMSPDDGRDHARSPAASRHHRRYVWRVAAVGGAHAGPRTVPSRNPANGALAPWRYRRRGIDRGGAVGAVARSGQEVCVASPARVCDRPRAHVDHVTLSRPAAAAAWPSCRVPGRTGCPATSRGVRRPGRSVPGRCRRWWARRCGPGANRSR